jgi:hypothetical protein
MLCKQIKCSPCLSECSYFYYLSIWIWHSFHLGLILLIFHKQAFRFTMSLKILSESKFMMQQFNVLKVSNSVSIAVGCVSILKISCFHLVPHVVQLKMPNVAPKHVLLISLFHSIQYPSIFDLCNSFNL